MVTSVYRSGYDGTLSRNSSLVELDQGEPEVVGHPAVAVLLRLGDARLVGGTRLVFSSQVGEHVAEARVGVPLVVGLDGQVVLQDRGLVLLASRFPVLVRQGQKPRRVVRVVGEHPLEVVDSVLHENLPLSAVVASV